MTIGEKIRQQRLERGVTRRELARRTGMSVVALFDIEHGNVKRPRQDTLRKISAALGVDVAAYNPWRPLRCKLPPSCPDKRWRVYCCTECPERAACGSPCMNDPATCGCVKGR